MELSSLPLKNFFNYQGLDLKRNSSFREDKLLNMGSLTKAPSSNVDIIRRDDFCNGRKWTVGVGNTVLNENFLHHARYARRLLSGS